MIVHFSIELAGTGENLEECWEDAIDSFALDPGPIPEEYEIME